MEGVLILAYFENELRNNGEHFYNIYNPIINTAMVIKINSKKSEVDT